MTLIYLNTLNTLYQIEYNLPQFAQQNGGWVGGNSFEEWRNKKDYKYANLMLVDFKYFLK